MSEPRPDRHEAGVSAGTARRWRFYETPAGARPVGDFLRSLAEADAVRVHAAMLRVRRHGLGVARALTPEIWEVRAWAEGGTFRVLFAVEGRRASVLLALVAFTKKTQRTPISELRLAEARLRDWRTRGARSDADRR